MGAKEKNTRFERRMKLAYIDEMRRGEGPPVRAGPLTPPVCAEKDASLTTESAPVA